LGYKYGGSEYAGAFHGPVVATNSDMTANFGHVGFESYSAVRGDFERSAIGRLGAFNLGMGTNHYSGVSGEATSTAINYGVYGYADGGTENWGGYFIGDGFFTGNVGLGTADVSGARLTLLGTSYGAFAGFKNSTASMEWRVGTWNDGKFNIVKLSGLTFTAVSIDTFGKVGIGTTSPSANLQVGVGTNDAIQIGSQKITDTGVWQFEMQGTMLPYLGTNNIGSASDEWQNVYCVALYESSDERLKTGIEDLNYGLDEIMRLRPVSYERTDRPWMGRNVGLIAQEVREVIGEAVPTQTYTVIDEETGEMGYVDNEYLSIDYTDMVPVLIKAMQEQQAQIEELKAEIEQLKEAK
ncbi:MAG: tail fiber domain-containing protein, partial [bacterium]